jgi:AcrR family transcriptional regulator
MAELGRKEREREARRRAILDAAEKVFIEKEFEGVSMDDVAAEAEFSKPTLYQYFSGKEELLFEVAGSLLDRYPLKVKPAAPGLGTALDRLSAFVELFYDTIRKHPKVSALMDKALSLRSAARRLPGKRGGEGPERGLALLDGRMSRLYELFVSAVAEGIADGSVRPDIDPRGAAFAVFFLIRGFLGLVSQDAAQDAGGMGRDELARYALGLVIDGMRRRA